MQKKFALQIPCVCRLNSRLSFYHHSHYVNELHCNSRPRISSEPCKHLVLHATFEECRRVGRATRALVAQRRVREQSDRETFSPAILHFRGSRYHDHHSLARYHDKRARARAYTRIHFKIDRARTNTFPFSRRSHVTVRNLRSVTQ